MARSMHIDRFIEMRDKPISSARSIRFIAFAIAFASFVAGGFANADSPLSDTSSQSFSPRSNLGVFLVSSSAPLDLPVHSADQQQNSTSSLTAFQIARLAGEKSGPAQLTEADIQSRSLSHGHSKSNNQGIVVNKIQRSIGYRLREVSSANALKLHYSIAACLQADHVFVQSRSVLTQQIQAQAKLVEAGVPVPDPLLIDRMILKIDDKQIENQSRLSMLRAQLASAIGSEFACGHSPVEEQAIVPSDSDVCEYIQQALRCRCDLIVLKELHSTITPETLQQWNSVGSSLSGFPLANLQAKTIWKRLFQACNNQDIEMAVSARKKWLCELIEERTKQISLEVEIAYEKKKTAALRWSIERDTISTWEKRVKQLEKLGDANGNLAEQLNAKLSHFESQGLQIERWLEWHQAEVDLMLAVGCKETF